MKKPLAGPENFYHYNRNLKERARELRLHMTKGEKKLWQMLRKRSLYGYMFTRQRPVLDYIADFMCKELRLIIESDGITHDDIQAEIKDRRRDKKLAQVGFTILRYKDWEIIASPDEVYLEIKAWIEERMRQEKMGGAGEIASGQPPGPLRRGR